MNLRETAYCLLLSYNPVLTAAGCRCRICPSGAANLLYGLAAPQGNLRRFSVPNIIRVSFGKSGAERDIRVRNSAIDQLSKMAFSPAHKNGATRFLSEPQNNQIMSTKSGTPLLFTGVSHNFAPLCDIHRRRPDVVVPAGLEPATQGSSGLCSTN